METKKTKKADLSRQKGMYFNLGLVLAMAFVISAFEWKSYGEITVPELPDPFAQLEPMVNVPITVHNIPRPPKPKPKKIIIPNITEDLTSEIEQLEDVIIESKEPVVDDVAISSMPEEVVDKLPFTIVEDMPVFDGFMKYLSENIKYPSQALRMKIEGKVFVEFIIDESGKMTKLRTIRGIGAGCDEEAIRVLENAPNWSPGKQRGVPVKVKMIVPINFQLGNR